MEKTRIGGMSTEEVADFVAGVGVDRVERLTTRETEVLRLLAAGCTYSRVADRLGVSPHTVCSHIKNAYRKLNVHSASAAVWRAVQLRLLGEPQDSIAGNGLAAPYVRKLICALLIASLAVFQVPDAHAGMVGAAAERAQIVAALDRPQVQAALEARGVSRDDARARVARLTDAEAEKLAATLDEAPAGGMARFDVLIYLVVLGGFVVIAAIAFAVKKIGEHAARSRQG